MIKAHGIREGIPYTVLGLSIENRLRLGEGQPIVITTSELQRLGIPRAAAVAVGNIVLCGGDTEESIVADLRAHRLPVPPDSQR